MKLKVLLTLAVLAALGRPLDAEAAPRGVVIAPERLSRTARGKLTRLVRRELRARPQVFSAVAQARALLPALERRHRARGRLISVLRPLRSLGPAGLTPMLRELALTAPPRGSLSDRAWQGWRVSLLEAVGSLRDARAEPVLRAILASKERDVVVLRAAAVALGRLGSSGAARTLARAATAPNANAKIWVPALGRCRRAASARALAALLKRAGAQPRRDALVAAALGQVGNVWAWQTPAVARSGEGAVTRKVAMTALVTAYPSLAPAAREVAVKALALVGHPSTRAEVARAMKQSKGARAAALHRLGVRLSQIKLLR